MAGHPRADRGPSDPKSDVQSRYTNGLYGAGNQI